MLMNGIEEVETQKYVDEILENSDFKYNKDIRDFCLKWISLNIPALGNDTPINQINNGNLDLVRSVFIGGVIYGIYQ